LRSADSRNGDVATQE